MCLNWRVLVFWLRNFTTVVLKVPSPLANTLQYFAILYFAYCLTSGKHFEMIPFAHVSFILDQLSNMWWPQTLTYLNFDLDQGHNIKVQCHYDILKLFVTFWMWKTCFENFIFKVYVQSVLIPMEFVIYIRTKCYDNSPIEIHVSLLWRLTFQ